MSAEHLVWIQVQTAEYLPKTQEPFTSWSLIQWEKNNTQNKIGD